MTQSCSEVLFFRPNPALGFVLLEGRDSADYLNRISTVPVQRLSTSAVCPGFILNALGKIIVSFWVSRLGPERFLFECINQKDASVLRQEFDRLHFGEQLRFEEIAFPDAHWIFTPPQPLRSNEDQLAHPFLIAQRSWFTVLNTKPSSAGLELSFSEFEALRIQSLLPQAGREITSEFNPIEVGLFETFLEPKGCYPGQEVIEKTVSIGSPARNLCLVEAEGPLAEIYPQPLFAGEVQVGTLTSGSGTEGLALVKKTNAHPGAQLKTKQGTLLTVKNRKIPTP